MKWVKSNFSFSSTYKSYAQVIVLFMSKKTLTDTHFIPKKMLTIICSFNIASLLSVIISNFLFKVRDMQLFLSLEHSRGHWKVINWSNFNSVVSQRTGRPKEKGRDGESLMDRAVWTHTTYIQTSVLWARFMEPQNNYNS